MLQHGGGGKASNPAAMRNCNQHYACCKNPRQQAVLVRHQTTNNTPRTTNTKISNT
jgi:hypothetical protein